MNAFKLKRIERLKTPQCYRSVWEKLRKKAILQGQKLHVSLKWLRRRKRTPKSLLRRAKKLSRRSKRKKNSKNPKVQKNSSFLPRPHK